MINSTEDPRFRAWIIQLLRRSSYMWSERNEALKLAKVGKEGKCFLYKCSCCGKSFTRKEIQIDHIIPVIDPNTGFDNWDGVIKRMFCSKEGFQVLCKQCHKEKTAKENEQRKINRALNKKNKTKMVKPKKKKRKKKK